MVAPYFFRSWRGGRTKAGWAGAEGPGVHSPVQGAPRAGPHPLNEAGWSQAERAGVGFRPDDSLRGTDLLMLLGRLPPPALPAMWLARREPSFQHIRTLLSGAQDPHGASISQTKQGRTPWPRLPSWPGSRARVPLRAQPAPARGPAASPRAGRHVLRAAGPCSPAGSPGLPEERSRQLTARLLLSTL